MKFSIKTGLAISALCLLGLVEFQRVDGFLQIQTSIGCAPSTSMIRMAAGGDGAGETTEEPVKLTKKNERRRILQSPLFFRNGFASAKAGVESQMVEEFTSPLINNMKSETFKIERSDITIKLAKSFGFCWGVERAVAMAYEAREHFPDDKLYITNEIIHNPGVNERLDEMGINFIKNDDGKKDFDNVEEGDVVILPAFGATLEEMKLLDEKKVKIVDTTCPWVSKVWNTVDKHRKLESTSIIHGKWAHEETIATASFCETYLIVKDMKEAEYVANYILNGGDREEFLTKFKNAYSEGFDPDKDLSKVGLANQTTMYKRETKAIGRLFEITMSKKFGPDKVLEHYREFDTICDATQERQDAITDMLSESKEPKEETDKLDMILIVGGFDSSNTAHLKEIPHHDGVVSYHINRGDCIKPDGSITHRDVNGDIISTPNFLPKGKITIGVTSGASTPDASLEDAIERIFLLRELKLA